MFESLSLEVEAGRFYSVRGPSGTGKSTFLRLINRLEEPLAGTLFFQGRPYADYPPPELRSRIIYIQQTPTLVEGSIRRNLLLPFGFALHGQKPRPEDYELKAMLDEYLLSDLSLDQAAESLSVGQKQRLCLIRGLLLRPSVLLMDEPTSALDKESAVIVEKAAQDLSRQGITVIVVAHHWFSPLELDPVVIEPGKLMGGAGERNGR